MRRSIAVPLIVIGVWLVLSLMPVVNLIVLFCLQSIVSLIYTDGVPGYETHRFVLLSVIGGFLAVGMLLAYFKSAANWKEVVFALLSICFLSSAFFPATLKLFQSVEPPFSPDFIFSTFVAGIVLTGVGQLKERAS